MSPRRQNPWSADGVVEWVAARVGEWVVELVVDWFREWVVARVGATGSEKKEPEAPKPRVSSNIIRFMNEEEGLNKRLNFTKLSFERLNF